MMKNRGVNSRSRISVPVCTGHGAPCTTAPCTRTVHLALRTVHREDRCMSDRPSKIWKEMPLDKRVQAADAFWRDEESADIQAQHVEAIVTIARRLNLP